MVHYENQEYVRLFQIKGLRFLVNDIWMAYYKKLHCIALVIDDEYTSYMPRKAMDETLKESLKLFTKSEESGTPHFEKEFLAHLEKTISWGNFVVNNLSQSALQEFLQELSECFYYYSKTEFFYSDAVFEAAQKNKAFLGFCASISALKVKGREHLNTLFFGEKAILSKVLNRVSTEFAVPVKDLQEYGISELVALFENKKVSPDVLVQRGEAFLMQGDGEKITYFAGVEAKKRISFFQKEGKDLSETKEVKGTIACSGKVQGKAKIIVSGYDNFDSLQSIIAGMNKGEILISETTSPELTLACKKAAAIVTNQGGLLSHAAVISRELNIPCIVGTEIATKIFKDGDLVEVDAEKGVVRKILEKA